MKRIKSLLIAITLSLACSAMAHAEDFGDGWKTGWDAGWHQVKGEYSFPPFAPLAPFPPLGQDDFQHGYNLGFLSGIAAAARE